MINLYRIIYRRYKQELRDGTATAKDFEWFAKVEEAYGLLMGNVASDFSKTKGGNKAGLLINRILSTKKRELFENLLYYYKNYLIAFAVFSIVVVVVLWSFYTRSMPDLVLGFGGLNNWKSKTYNVDLEEMQFKQKLMKCIDGLDEIVTYEIFLNTSAQSWEEKNKLTCTIVALTDNYIDVFICDSSTFIQLAKRGVLMPMENLAGELGIDRQPILEALAAEDNNGEVQYVWSKCYFVLLLLAQLTAQVLFLGKIILERSNLFI